MRGYGRVALLWVVIAACGEASGAQPRPQPQPHPHPQAQPQPRPVPSAGKLPGEDAPTSAWPSEAYYEELFANCLGNGCCEASARTMRTRKYKRGHAECEGKNVKIVRCLPSYSACLPE